MQMKWIAGPMLAAILACGPAWAAERADSGASPGELEGLCKAFLQGQEQFQGEDTNATLCRCLVGRVLGDLSLEEMQAYQSGDNPAGLQNKVRGIATECLRKAEE